MVLRMLRVALPQRHASVEGGGQALALLQAVGGFQAFRRAVPAPPNAAPVARFLLFERTYPDSVAACVDALHESLLAADTSPRDSEPVLRLSRLAADLEFQRRARRERRRDQRDLRGGPGRAGAGRPRRRPSATSPVRALPTPPSCRTRVPRSPTPVNFAIRYLTEYRYDAPRHRQPQRAARASRDDVRRSAATSSTCASIPRRACSRHVDYFGTEVLEFGDPARPRPPDDRRALARRDRRAARSARRTVGGAATRRATPRRRGEFLLPWQDDPRQRRARRARPRAQRELAAGDAAAAVRAHPRPLRVPRAA